MRSHALALTVSMSLAALSSAAHATPLETAQRQIAVKQFKSFVRRTPGMQMTHAANLIKETGRSAAWGTLVGGGTTALFGATMMAGGKAPIGAGFVLATVGVAGAASYFVDTGIKSARTATVARAVAENKLSLSEATAFEKTGVIDSITGSKEEPAK